MTNKIYVARSYGNGFITVVDGATNQPAQVKVNVEANAIAVNTTTDKIYLVGYEDHSVTVLDGATGSPSTVPAGTHLWGVAVDPANDAVYLPNYGDSRMEVIRGGEHSTGDGGKFSLCGCVGPRDASGLCAELWQ